MSLFRRGLRESRIKWWQLEHYSMVSAFIENVFVHDGGRIVVRFKYEQSIQDAVKALHTG